jgi:hypothetical protein
LAALNSKIKNKLGSESQIKKLTKYLVTAPVNLTLAIKSLDCTIYAAALKEYFTQSQATQAIRAVMIPNKLKTDVSQPLDTSDIDASLSKLRCKTEINTDKSIYHVFKYVATSLLGLGRASSLTPHDLVQAFYPYVEMSDRYNRVLISQSYLAYFLDNYSALFEVKDCGDGAKNEKQPVGEVAQNVAAAAADEEKEESDELVATTPKPSKRGKLLEGFKNIFRKKTKSEVKE